jgi:NAD dependent epimerase/dehydratase family enzyme
MRFGIMPILGSGRQVVSWIHVEDLARMYIEAALNESYRGVYNAVASHSVTHRVLMQSIAKAKGGLKIPAPVPPFMLQLIMGDASVEVLKSCTVSSKKIEAQGFVFKYPTIEGAVASIVAEG